MANKIATQSDAYLIGGVKPSGYSATKGCTNSIAMLCGCKTTGYASNRLVPENLLAAEAQTITLTIGCTAGYDSYLATVSVANFDTDEYYLQNVQIGYDEYSPSLYKISTSCQVPKNSSLNFWYTNLKYMNGSDTAWKAVTSTTHTITITGATTSSGFFSVGVQDAMISITFSDSGSGGGGMTPILPDDTITL